MTWLRRLEAARLEAIDAGHGENVAYMAELQHALAASRAAYAGLRITEIATLRVQLGALRSADAPTSRQLLSADDEHGSREVDGGPVVREELGKRSRG
jgi:hypothetical protein